MIQEQPTAWPGAALQSAVDEPAVRGAAGKNRSRARPVPDATHDQRLADRPGYAEGRAAREPLSTVVVTKDEAFSALAAEWAALFDECTRRNVFVSHEWMRAWWASYRTDAELAIVVARRGGRVRGLLPLQITTERRAGLRVRVLRFLADGSGETDHVGGLVPDAERDDVLDALTRAIERLHWDLAEFNQVPEGSPSADHLLRWTRRQRLHASVEVKACPIRQLPPTFDALLASLPSRLRTSLRSSRRRLGERHRVEFGLHDDRGQLDAALQDLFRNHESRWQGKGIAGVFSNPRRRAFYQQLTPALLARGWLRFFFLKLDGRTVAQQYCFTVDDTVMLLQEGFDFAHASDNVGNVLRSMVFEHLIASGARCYDFLAGSSRHKESWSDGVVNDLCIRCARRSWRGTLAFQVPRAIERTKDALRPWRDRLVARFRRTDAHR